LKAPDSTGPQMLGEKYQLVLPDRALWRCEITGIEQ
jgi:hypothetical protein